MVGMIDRGMDIAIFLTAEQVRNLQNEEAEGILVKLDKPKQQGNYLVSVDDNKSREKGFTGVNVVNDDFDYENVGMFYIYLAKDWYDALKQKGTFGTRYNTLGSKIDFYDTSRIKGDFDLEQLLKQIGFYIENKDKLPDSFG